MSKRIRMLTINKIKKLKFMIFGYEDSYYPNGRAVCACIRAINHWLDVDKILDDELRREALDCIDWCKDDCAESLEAKGWEIVRTKEVLE